MTSLDELRANAPAWDDLWWRSEVTIPTARAELVAQWVEQFAPHSEFHALAVEDCGKWVAALPLVGVRLARLLRAGDLPANSWVEFGGLLVDPGADVERSLDVLVRGTRELPWHLLWMGQVPLRAPRWNAFQQAVARAGMPSSAHEGYEVAYVPIDHNWEAAQRWWSRKHRSNMRRQFQRLMEKGEVALEIYSQLEPEKVRAWLQRGFEIEHRSWKGQAGSSVFGAGMLGFFVRQAETLARWGQLELVFLACGGRRIAFWYGISAKGVFHVCKMGYDPEYASFGPGQLLAYKLLEAFHGQLERKGLDCLGEINESQRQWKPVTYTIGQLLVAPRRPLGRVAVHAYHHWWPLVRRLRARYPLLQPKWQRASRSAKKTQPCQADPELK
jgi:CelD/BcsL family acetyltransferase involved in cellulose biosynthesis